MSLDLKNPYARLNDCSAWRGWKEPRGMGSADIFQEIGLTEAEYQSKIKPAKSDWKLKRERELEQQRSIKAQESLQSKHGDAQGDGMEGMTLEEKSRALGLKVEHKEPYWKSAGTGRIQFVKRKARGPLLVPTPSSQISTKHALITNLKTKNFNADISKKTKGARGKKKMQFEADLEYHEKPYRFTDGVKYIRHYEHMDTTDFSTSMNRASLEVYKSQWKGKGKSPLEAAAREALAIRQAEREARLAAMVNGGDDAK